MKGTFDALGSAIPRRRRQRHYSYDETLNEPAKLIVDEPVEVEEEVPEEENESVEETKTNKSVEPPAFEE